LVGWALVILALATSLLGWNIYVFAILHRRYTGTEWWMHARAALAPLGYLIAGVALIFRWPQGGWRIPAAALGLAAITPLIEIALALHRNSEPSHLPFLALAITAVPILLILIAIRSLLHEAFGATVIAQPMPDARVAQPHGRSLGVQETTTVKPRRVTALFWSIIGTGAVLPWAIGLAVREQLQHQGKPVLPPSKFIGGSPIELLFFLAMTAYLASPFLILAFLGRWWLTSAATNPIDASSYLMRLASIVGGFLGTIIGTVYLYYGVWQEFDPLFLLTPLPLLPLVGTAGGFLAGLFLFLMFQLASRGHRVD
jgi:hypothetical protein